VTISDRRGSPLRRVCRDLQAAFIRWNAARSRLIDLHFDAVREAEQEQAESRGDDLAKKRSERLEEQGAGENVSSPFLQDVG